MSKKKKQEWDPCPNCGDEKLHDMGKGTLDGHDNLLMCHSCGHTFPEPEMRKTVRTPPTVMPFGKFRNRPLDEVFRVEPSYVAWFYETVDGNEEVKRAIAALPGFAARLAKYRERKGLKDKTIEQRIEEVVARMFAVEPTPQETDALCDRLFNGPEAEDAAKPKITKSVHYGNYIQSGENLSCEKAGDERYRFQVREKGRAYEPWIVTPETEHERVDCTIHPAGGRISAFVKRGGVGLGWYRSGESPKKPAKCPKNLP